MAATYYICKKSGIIHPFFDFFQQTSRPYIRYFFENDQGFSGFFETKSFPPGDEMSLYRGYCQANRILAPDFRKNFKNFSESTVPAGARHRHPPMKAPQSSSPLFRFFWQTLSKKPHFSEKKRKKVPDRESTVTNTFHSLYSKFFGKRSVKNRIFPKKSRFFRFRTRPLYRG